MCAVCNNDYTVISRYLLVCEEQKICEIPFVRDIFFYKWCMVLHGYLPNLRYQGNRNSVDGNSITESLLPG